MKNVINTTDQETNQVLEQNIELRNHRTSSQKCTAPLKWYSNRACGQFENRKKDLCLLSRYFSHLSLKLLTETAFLIAKTMPEHSASFSEFQCFTRFG